MIQISAVRRLLLAAALLAGGCASAPPAPIKPPTIPFERKMTWMLQLEDRRILRVAPPPVAAPVVVPKKGTKVAAPPAPPPIDLTNLLADSEPRVRRRAALAIGRVGLPAGIQPLIGALSDADPEVRAMAAFGLGLIGDVVAAPALTKPLLAEYRLAAGG